MMHHQSEIPGYKTDPQVESTISALKNICSKLPRALGESPADTMDKSLDKLKEVYSSIIQVLGEQPAALNIYYLGANDAADCPLIETILGAIKNSSDKFDIEVLTYYLSLMLWFHLVSPHSWTFAYNFFADDAKVKEYITPCWSIITKNSPGVRNLSSLNSFFQIVLQSHFDHQGLLENIQIDDIHAECIGFISLFVHDCHNANDLLNQWRSTSKGLSNANSKTGSTGTQQKSEPCVSRLKYGDVNNQLKQLINQTLSWTEENESGFQFRCLTVMCVVGEIWQSHAELINEPAVKILVNEIGKAISPLATYEKSDTVTSFLNKTSKNFEQIERYFLPEPLSNSKYSSTQAFRHLLNLIDQDASFELWENPTVIDFTIASLITLNKQFTEKGRRMEVYAEYNRLNPKVSMSALLLNVNFMFCSNLANILHEDVTIPEVLTTNFRHFQLPPLAKPNYFFSSNQVNYDAIAGNKFLSHEKWNIERLIQCTSMNLSLFSMCVLDEIRALSVIDTYSADEICNKLFFNFVNLAFSSLGASMQLLSTFYGVNESSVCKMTHIQIHQIVNDILHVSKDPSLTWLSLINFAHDVCFDDIRWYHSFESLFDYLVSVANHDDSLHDSIVVSGLETFVSTFSNGACNSSSLSQFLGSITKEPVQYETLDAVELQSCYSMKILGAKPAKYSSDLMPFDFDLPDCNVITPKRVAYTVNSARQQSVHVDDFGTSTH